MFINMVLLFSDMGITQELPQLASGLIPAFKTKAQNGPNQTSSVISFSEGFCTSCVGIIDMVYSTRITARLNRDRMRKYYSYFINWAGAAIGAYGGKVVKNTGDGLLFYFPESGHSENSNIVRQALDCTTTMINLHANVNLKFRSESL